MSPSAGHCGRHHEYRCGICEDYYPNDYHGDNKMSIHETINNEMRQFVRTKKAIPDTIYIGKKEEWEILDDYDRQIEASDLGMNKKYHGMDAFIVNCETHLFVTKRE